MLTIRKVRLERLTNHSHFGYLTEVKALTNEARFDNIRAKTEREYTPFLALYEQEDETLEVIRKSLFTKDKQQADRERDKTDAGLRTAVKAALRHHNEDIAAAAKRTEILLNQYKNIARKSIKEQTSATYNLLQELKGAFFADVQTMGIETWVDELERRNNILIEVEKKQYDEQAAKTELRLRAIRKEIDKAYRAFIKHLEALIVVEGETQYVEYVRELNERAKKY